MQRFLPLVLLVAGASELHAHLMPAHRGTIVIRDARAYVALSLPAQLFAEADDDRDGRLSRAEVAAHAELLQRLVATRVKLFEPRGAARLLHASVVVERMDDDTSATPRPATDVLVLVVAAFDLPPSNLTLEIDGLREIALQDADAARLTVRATRGEGAAARSDSATISGGRSRMELFRTGWRHTTHEASTRVSVALTRSNVLILLATLVLVVRGWSQRRSATVVGRRRWWHPGSREDPGRLGERSRSPTVNRHLCQRLSRQLRNRASASTTGCDPSWPPCHP